VLTTNDKTATVPASTGNAFFRIACPAK